MPAVLFLSSDLMFSSRLAGAAQTLGVPLQLVAIPGQLAQKLTPDCRLVLIDLGQPDLDLSAAIAAIRTAAKSTHILAFGAHVNESALAAAQSAGCNSVLTRGQFQKQYAELLRTFGAEA